MLVYFAVFCIGVHFIFNVWSLKHLGQEMRDARFIYT